MIELSIPGYREIELKNLVLDFNGTIAFDGKITPAVRNILKELAERLKVYIMTADTFGTVHKECAGLDAEVVIIDQDDGGRDKEAFVDKIGAAHTVAIGNGVNDVTMLAAAALGIVVIGPEGCAGQALAQADIIVKDIEQGLDLLLNPRRLVATLRK